jgi:hypothetical protein
MLWVLSELKYCITLLNQQNIAIKPNEHLELENSAITG